MAILGALHASAGLGITGSKSFSALCAGVRVALAPRVGKASAAGLGFLALVGFAIANVILVFF